jgi:hypothetical protein
MLTRYPEMMATDRRGPNSSMMVYSLNAPVKWSAATMAIVE